MKLSDLGFDSIFKSSFSEYEAEGYSPARISLEHKGHYIVFTEQGEMSAIPTGKMYYEADEKGFPVVGDWVAVRILDEQPPHAMIHAVLPRKSKFSRKEPGSRVVEQAVAANVDTAFIVVGLDHNFRARRIERYLTLAWESGAEPVVLLTKADVCDDVDDKLNAAIASAPGVPVHALSVYENQGLEQLTGYLSQGRTIALLGSSGVGKSTIINHLLGREIQRVQEVRDMDSRGRHTTTSRQMFILPSGALMIDTPGMRELQLWNADEGLGEAFSDIESLAADCRFTDCSHSDEPGCRVREALETGELDPARFESYRKLQKELNYLERKQDMGAAQAERSKWKKIHKQIRHFSKG